MSRQSSKAFIELTKFAGKVAANILSVLAEVYIEIINRLLRDLGVSTLKVRSSRRGVSISMDDGSDRLDERIAKIDIARQSLTEALAAMDELKSRAEENKIELELLAQQVERAELDKVNLSGELKTLKDMAALDTESVRKILKLPTQVSIWTERVISFLLGVVASVLASALYDLTKRIF
ncbi:hypothetical protein [Bradyrhizobium sp. Bra78]|uniref:hypothetical protein n=1 Tax=Bradyrhizobium sp. Bra78 TaxID=2926010 RepID=UPI0021C8CE6E|nr:hypothetical protein [Bradyrhizobium sp. Bra78]